MVDIKLLVVACAALIFVWKVFYRKREEEEAAELFRKRAHDIILSVLGAEDVITAKYRTSITQSPMTIGRLDFNTMSFASPLVSGEHAAIKWNSSDMYWSIKDLGSMNGTRLNELVISHSNRQMSEEYPLRNGDLIILAEDVKLLVALSQPGAATVPANQLVHQASHSHLKIAPRKGALKAGRHSSQLKTAGEDEALVGFPRPVQVEYFCENLSAEFAFLTQVGLDHQREGLPSEDVVFWESPFGNYENSALFGVCDGHRGSEVSNAIPQLLPRVLSDLISSNFLFSSSDGIKDDLHTAFLEVDSKLKTDAGATTTVLLAEKASNGDLLLQVANVGDSLGILINLPTSEILDLTADHRVVSESEKKRLRQLGAPLTNNETRLGMLNLARAMGDLSIKMEDIGLVANPYTSPVVRLTSNKEHLIVIASDGLWDFVTKQEVATLAKQCLPHWRGARAFANALINLTSQKRGPTDDVSVFIARV